MKSIKTLLSILFAGFIIYACGKEYLDKRPLGQLDETALVNQRGIEGLLIGAYSLLDGVGSSKSSFLSSGSNWIYGSICGGEAYTGSDDFDGGRFAILPIEQFIAISFNEAFASKWGTLYDGVQRANDVLRIIVKATDISDRDQKRITAEARFLRGFYHFEAKKIWNKVPYIDETVTYGNNNYHVSNTKDIWPAIENDLIYTIENLEPDSYEGAPGRANKYTATALLAKAYMFQKKFELAKPLLESIINSGKYELVSYSENFNPETRNSKESVFSAQMSVNDGSEGLNGNFGELLNYPVNGGPGRCCGFFSPSQYLVNHFKTNPVTGLPDLDNFNTSDVKNDDGIESAEPFEPYTGTLDSRLDWTVGRRGIPYLDWGNHPGKVWTRDQNLDGPYSPKKNVYYQSQEGRLTDVSFWGGSSTNNINLIRYADILLWAAEMEAETGNFEKARMYVNTIRERAANPAGWVLHEDGTPAANYKTGLYTSPWTDIAFARKAIYYERILELAMEGHRFFDLVRWGIAGQEIKTYLQKEKELRTYLGNADFKEGINEYFPIPIVQIDLSAGTDGIPKMEQNPGTDVFQS